MKISISQSNIWNCLGDEFSFYQSIRECGFRYTDYNFFAQLSSDESRYLLPDWQKQAEDTRNRMEKIGIRTLIAHAPAGEPADPKSTENMLRWTKRAIEVASILGVETMAYHPGGGQIGMTHDKYMEFNIDYVQKLIPTLEKCNVTLLLENVGRWDQTWYCHDGEEMMEMIDAINHPLYQACLDTGHLGLQDGCQYETIKRLGSHLRGLNVQDNFGSLPVPSTNRMWRQDLHLPPLMGSVDFDEVMIGLKEVGYKGLFNLEPESPRCGYLRASDYCKEERLKTITHDLALEYYTCVYDIAKHILTCYDVFEE